MKKRLSQIITLVFGALASHSVFSQTLDPSFQATTLYTPAAATMATSQAGGKRLVLGSFIRPQTGASVLLMRYNADNTVDEAFASNVASLRGIINNVRVLASGKLLLVGEGALTLNGLARQDLLLLNTDGTADPSFNAGVATSTGRGRISAVQPDGKILIGGSFLTYNGVAAQRIVRLLPNGAVDTGFSAGTQFNSLVQEITLQTDGKILVGGTFDSPAAVARLLPNGTLDTSFNSPLTTSAQVSIIGVQANGKILLGSSIGDLSQTNGFRPQLACLLPNGTPDPAFTSRSANVGSGVLNTNDANEVIFQADGRFIIPFNGSVDGVGNKSIVRLYANGNLDATFISPLPGSDGEATVNSLQREANGQLLIAGIAFRQSTRRNNVLVVGADGGTPTSFNPVLLTNGLLRSIVQQADGKILAGGEFDEVNGQPANNLTRFTTDGRVDAAFSASIAKTFTVSQTVLQPDGKILVRGVDPAIQNGERRTLTRLLASGAVDNTFLVPSDISVGELALQQTGRIIVTSLFNSNFNVIRLLSSGQRDYSFTSSVANGSVNTMAIQPDGKIILGGFWYTYNGNPLSSLVRLQPDGVLDATFRTPAQTTPEIYVNKILLQPDGKIVAASRVVTAYPATKDFALFRLLPSGATDNTFSSTIPVTGDFNIATGLSLQPNGRILAASLGNNLMRKMPDGSDDSSFGNANFNGEVEATLVQPDGKILAAGSFTSVGGQQVMGLARLTAPNVLHVASAQLEARTQAWPVPAHETLRLSLDASAQPESVQLLDNLGRTVLNQPAQQAELTLPLRQLKAGVYLLRVKYAAGPVTRRVVVE